MEEIKGSKEIPEGLVDHILPFNWDVRKVWDLKATVISIEASALHYLLELPLWSSRENAGLLFDISPLEVIQNPEGCLFQYDRIKRADHHFPIDMLVFSEKQWILDGVHRLVKLHVLRATSVKIRLHNETAVEQIRV